MTVSRNLVLNLFMHCTVHLNVHMDLNLYVLRMLYVLVFTCIIYGCHQLLLSFTFYFYPTDYYACQ